MIKKPELSIKVEPLSNKFNNDVPESGAKTQKKDASARKEQKRDQSGIKENKGGAAIVESSGQSNIPKRKGESVQRQGSKRQLLVRQPSKRGLLGLKQKNRRKS